jgi:hypothetical protein
MEQARALLEVTAGIIPNRPEPELGRGWAITSAEWQQATGDGAQGVLLSQRNGQAQGYAAWLMMQPDRCNWVRLDWIWL